MQSTNETRRNLMETKQSQKLRAAIAMATVAGLVPSMAEKISIAKDIDGKTKPNPLAGNHALRRSSERMLRDGTKVKSAAQIQQQRKEQAEWNSKNN